MSDQPAPRASEIDAKLDEFRAFLASCRSRRDMSAGYAKWQAWTVRMAADGDTRFTTKGELTKLITHLWNARKSQLMSVDSLFNAESNLRRSAMNYTMGPTPETEAALRIAAARFGAVSDFFDGRRADDPEPAPSSEVAP